MGPGRHRRSKNESHKYIFFLGTGKSIYLVLFAIALVNAFSWYFLVEAGLTFLLVPSVLSFLMSLIFMIQIRFEGGINGGEWFTDSGIRGVYAGIFLARSKKKNFLDFERDRMIDRSLTKVLLLGYVTFTLLDGIGLTIALT